MTVAIPHPSPRWSIPLVVLGVIGVIAFFVVLYPPDYHAVADQPRAAVETQGGGTAESGGIPGLSEARIQTVPTIPTIVAPEQRAKIALTLKLGPDDKYVTVGQVANGARVEVVGRNEKGDWLAVSLNLGSKTYGWVRATSVAGVTNVSALPVAPVNLLR